MGLFKVHFLVSILVLVLVLAVEGDTPPGIAKNPSHARCLIKKYKHCYNLEHVCPKFCPNSCTVECVSCKPICGAAASYPPPKDSTPSYMPPKLPSYSPPPTIPSTPSKTLYVHPSPTPSTPKPTHPSPPTPSTPYVDLTPSSSTPTPAPSSPSTPIPSTPGTRYVHPPPAPSPTPPSPSTPTPSTPSETPYSYPPLTLSPPTPTLPSPSTPTPSSPSTPTHSYPPSTPTTHSPSTPAPSTPSSGARPATAKCKNKNYPQCYNIKHVCPSSCAGGCEVDCVTCKPVCSCDRPGAVCQDPRFIGGDGITFYFHGKKDKDFCLVSDDNLHINAHFIGRRNPVMNRDFTWVQSIAILFDNHQLFLGAQKSSTWDDTIDSLDVSFDGEPLSLIESDGSTWQSPGSNVSITRIGEINAVMVEVDGKFKVTAKVVPITEEDSRIHNYGMMNDDCLAHLDIGFKFYSLSDDVDGILGQTYRPGYVTHVKMGAKMPLMGGDRVFETSNLFAADCRVARFNGEDFPTSFSGLELPSLSCSSGIEGKGILCKR